MCALQLRATARTCSASHDSCRGDDSRGVTAPSCCLAHCSRTGPRARGGEKPGQPSRPYCSRSSSPLASRRQIARPASQAIAVSWRYDFDDDDGSLSSTLLQHSLAQSVIFRRQAVAMMQAGDGDTCSQQRCMGAQRGTCCRNTQQLMPAAGEGSGQACGAGLLPSHLERRVCCQCFVPCDAFHWATTSKQVW